MYFLAVVIPPLAVLLCGKPVQAMLNFLLWLCCLVPGIIHAWSLVKEKYDQKRHREMIDAIRSR